MYVHDSRQGRGVHNLKKLVSFLLSGWFQGPLGSSLRLQYQCPLKIHTVAHTKKLAKRWVLLMPAWATTATLYVCSVILST